MDCKQVKFEEIKVSQMFTKGEGANIWMKCWGDMVVCVSGYDPGRMVEIRLSTRGPTFLGEGDYYLVDADYYLGSKCVHRTYSI